MQLIRFFRVLKKNEFRSNPSSILNYKNRAMKKTLLILFISIMSLLSFAEVKDQLSLFKSDEALLAKLSFDDDTQKAIALCISTQKQIRDKYVVDLKKALKAALQKEDLNEANAINDEIKRVADLRFEEGLKPKKKLRHPPSAKRFKGHWYKVINKKLTWHQAEAYCENIGGYLACVGSKEEDEFLIHLSKGQDVWLGATDDVKEGTWKWVNGEPFKYANWGGSFDNSDGSQHWLMYWGRNKKWDDNSSGKRLYFICEWEK